MPTVGLAIHPQPSMRVLERMWILPIALRLRKIEREWFKNQKLPIPPQSAAIKYAQAVAKEASKSTWGAFGFKGDVATFWENPFVDVLSNNVALKCGDMVLKSEEFEYEAVELPKWLMNPAWREQSIIDLMRLIETYLPQDVIEAEIQMAAVRSWVAGPFQRKLDAAAKRGADISKIIRKLPTTPPSELFLERKIEQGVQQVNKLLTLFVNGGSVGKDMRPGIRGALNQSVMENWSPARLQKELFDTAGTLNRDWRRDAVTFASTVANNAMVGGFPPGTILRRKEFYHGMCKWCHTHAANRLFRVVDPNEPGKNPDKDVWVGKSNWGKKQSQWVVPADGVHPNCRGGWQLEKRVK